MRRTSLVSSLRSLWTDDLGATAVEYAIMAGRIAAVIVGTVGIFGRAVRDLFVRVVW